MNSLYRNLFRRLALACALAIAAAAPAAFAQQAPVAASAPAQAPTQPPAAAAAAPDKSKIPLSLSDGYILGVGDVVEVTVLGRDEFHPRVMVQNDGTIQLPYLHSVKASDLTVLQLRDKVRQLLKDGGYYTDPVVNVSVATFASRYVTVLGQVGNPGVVPVDRAYRVSEILARVGGVKPTASDVISLRRIDGQEMKLNIKTVASGGPDQDPMVSPGDKLFVDEAANFYIYGQIGAPGVYKFEPGMTLRKALARGGGPTERGSDKKVKVFRDGKEITRFALSDEIKGGDTIYVGERFF